MGHGSVHRNEQIEIHQHGRGIEKGAGRVQALTQIDDLVLWYGALPVPFTERDGLRALLQAEKPNAFQAGKRFKARQRRRPKTVRAVARAPLPAHAYLEAAERR